MGGGQRGRIWLDASNLVRHQGNVAGIQRVVSGLASGLREGAGSARVRLCQFDKRRGFGALDEPAVQRLLAGSASVRSQGAAGKLRDRWLRPSPDPSPFAPGDVLLNAGFMTYKPQQLAQVAATLAAARVRYVGLLHDLMPVFFPEWWEPEQQRRYRTWFAWSGREAALLLCYSEATRRDALGFFAAEQIAAPPLAKIPLGDELPRGLAAARSAAPEAACERPFVLYVSTLEVRKNHRLLFQVWKRLLAAHGAAAVPELVLVGKRGWLVDDFVRELEHARFLDGKIVWRERVDDRELARLYASCLFTVYPSCYEGFGLPVAEGMAFGKYCIASGSASLPEVGGDLADYHDPHDVPAATALVERALFDPAFRAARERAIRERFRPRPWSECADAVLRHVEPLLEP